MRGLIMNFTVATILLGGNACSGDKNIGATNNNAYTNNNRNLEEIQLRQIASDRYLTELGELSVTVIGHASLMFEINGKVIHVDPNSKVADYLKLPKADLVLLTHEHSDHLDLGAIELVKQANTRFVVSKVCADSIGHGEILENGDKTSFERIDIQAVPAYNKSKNPDGQLYHPKGRGNGYMLTLGSERVYIAGDTENIPEMEQLKGAYIAFLPKNTPYTMTDDMFIDAVQKVSPVYLYPYHFSVFNDKGIIKALDKYQSKTKLLVRSMSNL